MPQLDTAVCADQGEQWALRRASARDARLRGMITEYHAALWRFLARMGVPEGDVDDAMQEVVLIVARKLDEVAAESERSFLFQTAWRVATAMRRRSFRRHEVIALNVAGATDSASSPENLAEQKRLRELLDSILSRMPVDMRVVFVMFELEELTMAEIAQALEIAPGTVASRLRRARGDFNSRLARIEALQLGDAP